MVTWVPPASVAPRMPDVQAMPAEPDQARRLAMPARLMTKTVRRTAPLLLRLSSAANSDPVAASRFTEMVMPRLLRLDGKAALPRAVAMTQLARYHDFLTLQSRGVLALPPELRKRYQLDRPGTQVEVTEREDGVLELRPQVAVPAIQAWFWTQEWQDRERAADADLVAGRVAVTDDAESFLAELDT